MRDISSIDVKIHQNNAGFCLQLSGDDFSTHKSLIIAELARGSIWQLEAIADGFPDDLRSLMKHFGIVVDGATPDKPTPATVATSAVPLGVVRHDGKIWIDGEEFDESPDDWV